MRAGMLAAALGLAGLAGCTRAGAPEAASPPGMLSPVDRAAGWRLLFDGRTTDGWRGYRMDSMPPGWAAVDGMLVKEGRARDIVTREQFGDFDLRFEWRLAPGGNSGLFYRATEAEDYVFWTGPEYQLLDDSLAADGRSRMTAAGAAHSVYPAPAGIVRHDAWNDTRLVARGAHVEHWLNGVKLLEYELAGADWEARVAASKFRVWRGYGRSPRGFISFQGDHAGRLALRNIRILELR